MNQLPTETWLLVLAFFNGICIAIIYFYFLWHSVSNLNHHYRPALWLGGSILIRFVFFLLAFKWTLSEKSTLEILAVIAGLMLVRGIILHQAKPLPTTTHGAAIAKPCKEPTG